MLALSCGCVLAVLVLSRPDPNPTPEPIRDPTLSLTLTLYLSPSSNPDPNPNPLAHQHMQSRTLHIKFSRSFVINLTALRLSLNFKEVLEMLMQGFSTIFTSMDLRNPNTVYRGFKIGLGEADQVEKLRPVEETCR